MENNESNDKPGKKKQPAGKHMKRKARVASNAKQFTYFNGLSNCWNDASLTESFELYRKSSESANVNLETSNVQKRAEAVNVNLETSNVLNHSSFDVEAEDSSGFSDSHTLENCLKEDNIDLLDSSSSYEALLGSFALELGEAETTFAFHDSRETSSDRNEIAEVRAKALNPECSQMMGRESYSVEKICAPLRPRTARFTVPYKRVMNSKCDLPNCQYCVIETNCEAC